MNRESLWRRGVRRDDGDPIEAVKTSQARDARMFMRAVAGERIHLRCPRVRARPKAEDDTQSSLRGVMCDAPEERVNK